VGHQACGRRFRIANDATGWMRELRREGPLVPADAGRVSIEFSLRRKARLLAADRRCHYAEC
ncbi:MAG TPA: hypothetical protein VMX97_15310, partial [Hyphomicrobiaceae bacterium]|nr:hypothetical protein [Hyphomicrobiaceae bacterium]